MALKTVRIAWVLDVLSLKFRGFYGITAHIGRCRKGLYIIFLDSGVYRVVRRTDTLSEIPFTGLAVHLDSILISARECVFPQNSLLKIRSGLPVHCAASMRYKAAESGEPSTNFFKKKNLNGGSKGYGRLGD